MNNTNDFVQSTNSENAAFNFKKAQHLSNDIYNLVVVLDGYCKNQQMVELDCLTTTIKYLRQNSAKLSCMFANYINGEKEEF